MEVIGIGRNEMEEEEVIDKKIREEGKREMKRGWAKIENILLDFMEISVRTC
jgi:hypothetical protein